ncbi:SIR2-like domain-containing protein [Vibrio crassostreae]|nr:SIR2-like domain-containing protein [Vibrio crassostreae]
MSKTFNDSHHVIERVEQYLESKLQENDEFNKELNIGSAVKISTNGPKVKITSLSDCDTAFEYDVSDILYWVERDTYFDELTKWSGVRLEEKHKEAKLFLKQSNQFSVFLDLVDALKRQRIAPFIGAGASQPAGYLGWGAALEQLSVEMGGGVENEVKEDLANYKYLEAAETLYQKDEDVFKYFVHNNFRLKPTHEEGKPLFPPVIELLPNLTKGCVVTTNFDRLIEKRFETHTGKVLDGCMYGKQEENSFVSQLLKGENCLMKLHGDSEKPQSYVFTESQYKEAYGDCAIDFKKQLPRSLRQIYISYSLLFIGCSLEQDRTLELFKSVKEEGHFEIPSHFALLADCDAEEKAKKMGRLLRMNIKPIWYSAAGRDHSLLEKILNLAIDVSNKKISLGSAI